MSERLEIPGYVSDENRRKILELGEESEREVSQVECCEYLIRHWCETVEDGNPLYLDEAYARSRGFRGLVAQPGMLICTLTLPYRWPWTEGYRSQRLIHFYLKELLELPVGILANYEKWFHEPVQIGDRISTTVRLANISPWKRTRLGEGYFTTIETRYYNQHDVVVAHALTSLFSYGGKRGADGQPLPEGAGSAAPDPVERAVPSAIEDQAPRRPARRGRHRGRLAQRDRGVPGVVAHRLAAQGPGRALLGGRRGGRCAAGARHAHHCDALLVHGVGEPRLRSPAPQQLVRQNKSRTRDMFLGTHFNLGMMSRFMTDWGGPESSVRRIQLAMRRSICAGEDLIMTGRVVEKYAKDGEHRVDLGRRPRHGPGPGLSGGWNARTADAG